MAEPFISYAQNFEDVILFRALKHVERGAYVDIGANDPVVHSVSLAFYQRGWRGVHVEPMPSYAAALRRARPDETTIQAAVSSSAEPITFFGFDNTGLSTTNPHYAEKHRLAGFENIELEVSTVALSAVLAPFDGKDLHWMKIDVEGMEGEVLSSWLESPVRPWIVLVESTLPLSPQENFEEWDETILRRGYRFVYFDGLNRFYLHQAHLDLIDAFGPGPNVFDDFCLNKKSDFCRLVRCEAQRAEVALQSKIQALRTEIDERDLEIQRRDLKLDELYRSWTWRLTAPLRHLTRRAHRT